MQCRKCTVQLGEYTVLVFYMPDGAKSDGEIVITANLCSMWVDINCACKYERLELKKSFTLVFSCFLIDSFSVLLFANTSVDFM